MNLSFMLLFVVSLLIFHNSHAISIQLTFELPDNERQCFYEHIGKDVNTIVEYQVVTGGNYDVDMIMKSPRGRVLYQEQKKQYDSFSYKADVEGVYEVCFSNEFSTYTHKIVFMDWQVGEEEPLVSPSSPDNAMTFMESSAQSIHDKINEIIDHQTHYRLREFQGREHGEELNERVQLRSLLQLGVILLVGFFQVFLIRSFFSNRK